MTLRQPNETTLRRGALLLWIALAWMGHAFHEPWRDEAQAWLVARYSPNLWELLIRASVEATGPTYYFIIWPFARFLSDKFEVLVFALSWIGTLLAVGMILLSRLFPLSVALLVAFGYLFGYEYAVPARLYGWGCFFLLLGIWADRRSSTALAIAAFCVACSIQLNLCFGFLAWAAYQAFQRRGLWRYVPGAVICVAMVFFLKWSEPLQPWGGWSAPKGPVQFFSTLLVPFLPLPGMGGWAGLLICPVALSLLAPRALVAFCLGFAPFVVLFVFRYAGSASARHGGALFLVWVLLALDRGAVGWRKKTLRGLLALGVLSGFLAYADDLLRPYSNGMPAARAIENIARAQDKTPLLLTTVSIYPFVVSAALDQPYFIDGYQKVCPVGPGSCFDSAPVAQPKACPSDRICFALTDASPPPALFQQPGRWSKVFEPRRSIKMEDMHVFQFLPE